MKNDCIFCAITAGEIPSFTIYEDEVVCAFLDVNPFTTGHVLVVPKAHYEGLLDVPEALLAEIITRVRKIAAHVKQALSCEGFNILQNNGAVAGQSVKHLHFHIVPRQMADKGKDISFVNHQGNMEELKKLASRIAFV